MSNFIISLSDAENIVENFQDKIPAVENIVQYGGIIDLNSLPFLNNPPLVYKGLMAWFGLNEQNELVLFFEDDVFYDPNNLPKKPSKQNLIESDRLIRKEYLGTILNGRIQNLSVPEVILNKKDKITPYGQVISAIKKFENLFPKDPAGQPFNKYPFGFFENDQIEDFSIFMNQSDLKYLSYFFAYDDKVIYHAQTNRIRIVLVGLNSKGSPIINGRLEAGYSDGILLQNSWPPPPNS